MQYKSDNLYNYNQKYPWIIEIFRNIRHIEDKPRNFYKNEWFEFHPLKWGVHTTLEEAGYFDERPQLTFFVSQLLSIPLSILLLFHFNWWLLLLTLVVGFVGIGELFLNLPFKTGIQDCESRQWGFYIYYHGFLSETDFVICKGSKTKHIDFPWNLEWYRTSHLAEWGPDQPMIWLIEYKGHRLDYWDTEKHGETFWKETHPYTYVLESGEVQERQATIRVKEMEWRRKGWMWSPFLNQVIKSIDVQFDKEVGERTGSWKGGTVGCGYELLPNESPYQCFKRMEKERKF